MFKSVKRKKLYFFLCALLSICIVTAGSLATYDLQSVNIPLEVKEPIEILDYPSDFSLFPGETTEFDIAIHNMASVIYSLAIDFALNNTDYQSKYVTFSNETYTAIPGTQIFTAWLRVSTDAPAGDFLLMAKVTREGKKTSEPQTPFPSNSSSPSSTLLGAGARWAAREGKSALYINSKDNWEAHHSIDGADWGPWSSYDEMEKTRTTIANTLKQQGFEVTFAGDVPAVLNGYDLVVFEALWAVEPEHAVLVREYLANGGGVVVLAGVPCYFSVYCKDRWPYLLGGMNLTSFKDWFGATSYVNTGGSANVVYDNPFGTQFLVSDMLFFTESRSAAAVSGLEDDSEIVATWSSSWGPMVFAFTHEFGEGRVYYQAHW